MESRMDTISYMSVPVSEGGAAVNLFRITVAVILVMLAGLAGYAWERGKHKRFARAWAEELINPTFHLIK